MHYAVITWGKLIGAFLKAYWKPLALLALIAALFAAGYLVKAHDDAQEADIRVAREAAARAEAEVAALKEAAAKQEAATKAAAAARDRNDAVIPKARRESAERVDRADTADLAQRVRDVEATRDGYAAAAGAMRGSQPR